MSSIKNVIIIGAGGNLGPSVLNAFLKHSSFNTSVLSRKESTSTFPISVKVHKADYNNHDDLVAAFKGQDAVISIVGGAALGDQNKYIDAAIAAGVQRFIPSEFGSNTVDERVRAIVPIFSAKVGAVEYLKKNEDKISWSSVITGPFFDWGLKVGFLGFNAANKTVNIIDQGKAPFSGTNLHTIGLALVKTLEKPDITKNQYIYISSFDTTQNDVRSVVEKVKGEKFTENPVDSKALIKEGQEKLGKGDFSGIGNLIKGAVWGAGGLGDNRPAGLWNEKLGLPKEDLEETIRTALAGKLVGQE